ncbi:hypothetical protein F5Y19DRAFT_200411 [Xylariaceae sp. FL1651]|nr:hypothetical protein F5Y19DRAFT_200411 [Xylariaceae sp. FL1651]
MQLTMGYSNDVTLALPPSRKSTALGVPKAGMARPQYKKQHRTHPRSQPFDPEDLRRRLYVVIAEQEAQKEKRQRERVDALPAKKAQVQRDQDTQRQHAENIATLAAAARPVRSASTSKPKSKSSLQDRLRQKPSKLAPAVVDDAVVGADMGATYRHVPQQAAAQFSRTATSDSMRDKSLVHSLSQAALRFYVQGSSSTDRQAIESSITPGKQRSILQRAQSQRERQHGRNQFQDARLSGEHGVPWRKSNKSGPGGIEPVIPENDVPTLADLHLRAHHSHGESEELQSSEETLIDTTTANEHRIDWSQSDELLPHERRGMRLTPLLRKTSSIWTLGGKLGHLRKNSNDRENNKLRIVTIQEGCDEDAEAEADDGSTPMSPNSSGSSSGKLGILSRLKFK